jgi:hypothetical protein
MRKEEKKEEKSIAGLFIPAGLFLGMGLGFALDNFVAWMFGGLGAGFVAFAIMLFIERRDK